MNYNIDEKIPDLSGNGNDGILSPIYPCDCPILVDSFDKKHGKAVSLDGINDYLSVPHSSTLNFTTAITFEAFVYLPTGYPMTHMVISAKGPPTWYFAILDGKIFSSIWINGIQRTRAGITVITPDKWHHIVTTYDVNTGIYRLYLDGNIDGDFINSGDYLGTNALNIYLGAFVPVHALRLIGLLDTLLLFNRSLSEEEIKLHSPF
jgi:hypothetical protein